MNKWRTSAGVSLCILCSLAGAVYLCDAKAGDKVGAQPAGQPRPATAARPAGPARPAGMFPYPFGIGVGKGGDGVPVNLNDFDYKLLGAAWYFNWWCGTPQYEGLEYSPLVGAYGTTTEQALERVEQAKNWYPDKTIWLIGNEIGFINEEARTPEQYARHYHDLYAAIKQANPSFLAATGAVLPTDQVHCDQSGNRRGLTGIQYIEEVRKCYKKLYQAPMPVDWYNIHPYVWNFTNGKASARDFAKRVKDFRAAMKKWGEQDKPLMITEIGVLDNFVKEKVKEEFIRGVMEFCATETDPAGCPSDYNRLVQRMAWFHISESAHTDGNNQHQSFRNTGLFDQQTKELTALGKIFAEIAAKYGTAAQP